MFVHSEARAALCHCIVPQVRAQAGRRNIQHASRACPAKAHVKRSLGVRALSSAYALGPSRAQAISSSESPRSR